METDPDIRFGFFLLWLFLYCGFHEVHGVVQNSDCKLNQYGEKCDKTCATCKARDSASRVCSEYDGTCWYGCKEGWFGNKTCEKRCISTCSACKRGSGICLSCVDGKHGDMCYKMCNPGCKGGVCGKTTGNCSDGCSIQLYGPYCNHNCSTGCNTGACDQVTGACTEGCLNMMYGPYCNHACSTECNTGTCDRVTGACIGGCSPLMYGPYCNQTCSDTCSDGECGIGPSQSLTCTHGCVDGWWGSYCQYQCSENCRSCGVASGLCDQCKRHKYGYNCSQTCSDGCVGQDCDMTGVCREGCEHGWMGEKCQFSTLWFLLPGCATAALLTVSAFLWICRRNYRTPNLDEHDENSDTARVKSTSRHELSDFTSTGASNDINNSAETLMNISEDLPLLRAEAFVNQSAVVTRISLEHFHGYVRKQILTGGLIKQFSRLPINPVYPCYEGDLSQSVIKNRYGDILPYDYNRVVLTRDSEMISSNYTNASFVKGFAQESFIATQGPFAEVIGEFWTMILQNDVSKIVMLTNCIENNRVTCEQYWPDLGQSQMITPSIVVECLDESVEDHFIIRTLGMTKECSASRVIKQFHFTTWPDKDVPANVTSLLHLHTAVTSSMISVVGPVVVHCSAGVGRTGTYIALDYLIQQAKAEGIVDVFECVLRLRHQRMNLVQTEEQYLLIHDILLQAIDSLKDNGSYSMPSISIDLDTEESTV